MAVRKKKAPAAKKSGTAKKTTRKKKPAAKKTTSKKKPAAARKKAAAKKAPAAKSEPAPKAKSKAGVSSMTVNLGHVFALRPRVSTSFRPDDLRTARHFLQDESYKSIDEAARAVAQKALDLTHNPKSDKRFKRGR